MIILNEIYQDIARQKPPVIYISGKTSTGKSTFGRKLHDDLNYHVIELEAVLLKIVKEQGFDEQATFRRVLYDAGEFEEKNLFFEATDRIIASALTMGKPVVIEGAVANVGTLQRILQPAKDLLFLYFHPSDIAVYVRNLTQRFMQSSENSYGGLPLKFWQLVDDRAFKTFCKTRQINQSIENSIHRYAVVSQQESLERLDIFQQKFKDIVVVEIQS
jgi:adenylate kinase family enzyme